MEAVGLGTKFQRESAVPGTYEDVAKVANLTPPQLETDDVEVEELNPADAYKRYLPGLIDAGEVSFTLNFDPDEAGHTALMADQNARAIKNYKVLLPDGTAWTFAGYVKGFAPSEVTAGEIMQAEVTVKVSGKPTLS